MARYRPDTAVSGGSAFTDTVSLKINTTDDVPNITDAATFAIALGLTDDVPTLTETLGLDISGSGFADAVPNITETNSFTMRVWLSGSTSPSAAWTNTANANGQNDAAVATGQTTVTSSATINLESAVGANCPSGLVLTSVIYRGWFRSANTLATSTGSIRAVSTGALFTTVVMFTNSALNTTIDHLGGTFTFDLLAAGVDTEAKLQSMTAQHRCSDAVAGVSPHNMTVDAGCLEITGAFV